MKNLKYVPDLQDGLSHYSNIWEQELLLDINLFSQWRLLIEKDLEDACETIQETCEIKEFVFCLKRQKQGIINFLYFPFATEMTIHVVGNIRWNTNAARQGL